MNRERTVRISAFPAHWLVETNSYGNSKKITWSTGKRIRPGDIQIFATSATLGDAPELADDPRRDSVHSIWEAATPPKAKYGNRYWPIQAKFKLLIKLRRPVPKRLLHRAGILFVAAQLGGENSARREGCQEARECSCATESQAAERDFRCAERVRHPAAIDVEIPKPRSSAEMMQLSEAPIGPIPGRTKATS